jgi:pyruvate/2-oxoglutarate dehydrogenase complex dihydrolipoamide acyltransferase (E2) component
MSQSKTSQPGYSIDPKNKFFEAVRGMCEFEIHPGNTVTFISEVDLTEIEKIRATAVGQSKPKPSYTAFVVKACALALKKFPYANRRVSKRIWLPFCSPRLQQFHQSDILVMAERFEAESEAIMFSDIIRNADRLSLSEITQELRNLASATLETNARWRDFYLGIKKLPSWVARLILRLPYRFPSCWVKYRGSALSISSPAKYGVDSIVATWTSPCGVSFGLVKQRPIVKNGEIVACPTFNLVLNFDRRVMAGAQAAKFYKYIHTLLERGEEL